MKIKLAILLAATLVVSQVASAALVKFDDFESYAPNSAVGGSTSATAVNGWWGDVSGYTAVADPTNSANQVLQQYSTGSSTSYLVNTSASLAMPQGTTPATLYFRMMAPSYTNLDNAVSLLAQSTMPGNWSGGRSQIAVLDGNPTGILKAKNGSSWSGTLFNPTPNTWYSFWFVVNNVDNTGTPVVNDTYDIWVQGGDQYPTALKIAAGFKFRAGDVLGGSITMLGLQNDNDNGHGTVYYDDFYIDATGDSGGVAVPEPATLCVLALGGLGVLIRRRGK